MRCRRVKMARQNIGQATGAHVKKLVVASMAIAAVAVSAPVRAADLPPYSVAKGPIIGGFDWEGFYVGGHIGSATDNVSFTQTNVGWTGLQSFAVGPLGPINTNTGESGSLGATSVTGGMQIGYNWLLPGPFLVGLEADISGCRAELDHPDLSARRSGGGGFVDRKARPLWFGTHPVRLGVRQLAVLRHRRFRLGLRQVHAQAIDGTDRRYNQPVECALCRHPRASGRHRRHQFASQARLGGRRWRRMGVRPHLDGQARISAF